MPLLSQLLLAGIGVLAPLAEVGPRPGAVALEAAQRATLAATAPLAQRVGEAAPHAPVGDRLRPSRADRLTIQGWSGRRVSLPGGCEALSSELDVLVHFHGVETTVEPAFFDSGIQAALVLVNEGEMSGPYERRFSGEGALEHLLSGVESVIDQRCGGRHQARRVALSAWSAGYGAVLRILERTSGFDRVDAVLLADGLHVGYERDGSRRPNGAQLRPFSAFAVEAAAGKKLFAVSHSSVKTDRYASTTETADALLESIGAARQVVDEAGPRPGMWLATEGGRRGFQVFGYTGEGRRDHCDQLRAIGATLFPVLLERWASRVEAAP